jgi:hypothetical protein
LVPVALWSLCQVGQALKSVTISAVDIEEHRKVGKMESVPLDEAFRTMKLINRSCGIICTPRTVGTIFGASA